MTLSPGSKIGSYDVSSLIGSGGMGEVYLARDSRLGRDVALKVLLGAVSQDAERLARFEREAQVLASLNHSNIAALYGIENTASGPVLVMEYVAGPTLADRIAQGRLPLDEALPIAREIAAALDAAHVQGIAHRDLKPANIKVRPDGTVKVLDFGLAKAIAAPDGADDAAINQANSPTITTPAMTMRGTILGTAAYMSPEQAKGKPVDRRADIWAFGCVLYEMLTGKRPFVGEDLNETLVSILRDQPDLDAVPPQVRKLLAKCFEKDPRKRLRDIGDAFDLVEEPGADQQGATAGPRVAWLAWSVAVVAIGVAAFLGWRELRPAAAASIVRFQVPWPRTANGIAVGNFFEPSPDGKYFAIVSDNSLWVRSVDEFEAVRLDHTEGASYPFWSSDSSTIGFFAQRALNKIARTGGAVQRICPAVNGRGASWSGSGTIIFAAGGDGGGSGMWQVSENGGTAAILAKTPSGKPNSAYRYPQFLPDNRHFLYLFLDPDAAVKGVYISDLDGASPARVMTSTMHARFVPTSGSRGHLLFQDGERVMAQAFDYASHQLSGGPVMVADHVSIGVNTGLGNFSVSQNGVLTFGDLRSTLSDIAWFDRQGKRLNTPIPSALGFADNFAIDKTGRLAVEVAKPGSSVSNIWQQPAPDREFVAMTSSDAPGWANPVWSPDGTAVAYTSDDYLGFASYEIRRRNPRGGEETVLFKAPTILFLYDWTPDGKWIVASQVGVKPLFLVNADHLAEPTPLSKIEDTDPDEFDAQVSPDGRWLAYAAATLTMPPRVLVRALTGSNQKWIVSPETGRMPRWRRDGKALFYLGPDGKLHETNVSITAAEGPTFSGDHQLPVTILDNQWFSYVPSPDGQRFLVTLPPLGSQPPVNVVLNWRAGLPK